MRNDKCSQHCHRLLSASDVRIWYAMVTLSSIGKFLFARITIPNRFAGMNATYAPNLLVEPVLLIQTFS
jgi:hypothetical protein